MTQETGTAEPLTIESLKAQYINTFRGMGKLYVSVDSGESAISLIEGLRQKADATLDAMVDLAIDQYLETPPDSRADYLSRLHTLLAPTNTHFDGFAPAEENMFLIRLLERVVEKLIR